MGESTAGSRDMHRTLREGWRMARCPAGLLRAPDFAGVPLVWMEAPVPGTVAQALAAQGQWSFANPTPLNDADYWYHLAFAADGAARLRFEGLATLAQVWLNGELVLASGSMFETFEIAVDLRSENHLHICFRALQPRLDAPQKRARWKPKLIVPAALRSVRTTVLGHMPTWCPPVDAVGPWREISLLPADALPLGALELHATLEGTVGVLRVELAASAGRALPPVLHCAGQTAALTRSAEGRWAATLRLPDVACWWPHTHGTPALHAVTLDCNGLRHRLGNVGFRQITLDRDTDSRGFGIVVNAVPIFCRGANWTTPDLVRLPGDRADLVAQLTRMRDAGMNMVRITGNMFYESPDFYALCDDLGILVWQDFPFANFDYPQDAAFLASVDREATQFLARTQASPCLAVLCGGTETLQQAAMFGLGAEAGRNPIFDTLLPRLCAALRPDVIYVPNSPCGGTLPFRPDAGVSHYYGVSAYRRPLEDARLANVRFASECLCFANVPDHVPVRLHPDKAEILHHDFAPRVDFDAGAEWFFEDVRNHYVQLLYGVDAGSLRQNDPARYLDMSRAVSAQIMEEVFAQWRRHGSVTRGGLVWFLRDLWPGAGWAVLDFTGRPKAAWYGLQRAFATVQVLLVDEGLNGLDVHVINETAEMIPATLTLRCLNAGGLPVISDHRPIDISPRSSRKFAATDLFGGFFDTTYAYRFGPPAHAVTIASLARMNGTQLAEAFHFPQGRGHACHATGLAAKLVQHSGDWFIDLTSATVAQSVCIADPAFEPLENWFHLAPGVAKRVALRPWSQTAALPCGTVRALNDTVSVAYGATS